QLGAIAALLLAKWVLDAGWNWWAAFVIALGVGLLTGLLVERFLVAPLRRRTDSPVRLLLLTLGVSQLLLGITYIPSLRPDPGKGAHVGARGIVLGGRRGPAGADAIELRHRGTRPVLADAHVGSRGIRVVCVVAPRASRWRADRRCPAARRSRDERRHVRARGLPAHPCDRLC